MRYFTKVMSTNKAKKEMKDTCGNYYLTNQDSLDFSDLLETEAFQLVKVNQTFVNKVNQQMLPSLKDDQYLRVRVELINKEMKRNSCIHPGKGENV